MTKAVPRRNEPCWCGSGKKYKKCHREADLADASDPPLVPRPRDIVEIRDSILAPRQVRSDEIG